MTNLITTEDLYLKVPGGDIFVRLWQPELCKSSLPIILLHDSLGSVELWRDFPQRLAEHLQQPVFAYDRLGFGQSSPRDALPSWHFVEEEAEVYFPELLRGLDIQEFALLGHSVGGAMALNVAAVYGQICRWVVTEAAQTFVEERTREGIRQAEKLFVDPSQFERLKRWHGDKAQWVLDAWIKTWLAPEFSDWNLSSALARIESPVLALHGDQDEYGSSAFPELIVRQVPTGAQMRLLSECGHVPHREQQEQVLAEIESFLGH
ncbi:Pimeloyl-ACP methyl ester carboxylesterase [Marinospirillum celere]|uniref:Pimeloyl-ACP methyl ester carboxylesterase n=1 Tax=Marinospirillum celere TaxID=1122252 RepID=A0A1I1FRB2_9GAMM|nr:alpha/beta hydrolase [Marinospirillum celere]SFC01546.1 Pimeloyl-ACP methyl ester carboxylesterase [Marinospirillum celere]